MQKTDRNKDEISKEIEKILQGKVKRETNNVNADCPMSEMAIAYGFKELEPEEMPNVRDHLDTCRYCEKLMYDVRSADADSRIRSDQPVKILPALSTAISHSKKPPFRKRIKLPDFSRALLHPKLIGSLATACLVLLICFHGLRYPQIFDTAQEAPEKRPSVRKKLTKDNRIKPVAKKSQNRPSTNDHSINSITINEKKTIDPFENPFEDRSSSSTIIKNRKKWGPRTPLERLDISQLKLVGIILSAKGNKAMVEDASGQGYVMEKGTYVGRNSGKVVEIMKEKVIIEEKLENAYGKIVIFTRELKLNKR